MHLLHRCDANLSKQTLRRWGAQPSESWQGVPNPMQRTAVWGETLINVGNLKNRKKSCFFLFSWSFFLYYFFKLCSLKNSKMIYDSFSYWMGEYRVDHVPFNLKGNGNLISWLMEWFFYFYFFSIIRKRVMGKNNILL